MRKQNLVKGSVMRRGSVLAAIVGGLGLVAGSASAGLVTTNVVQAAGQDWNIPTIWTPNGAPSAGNTYEAIAGGNPTRLRNPAVTGTQTFGGDSLQIDTGAEIRSKGVAGTILGFPGVGGNPGLILNGGTLNTGDDVTFGLSGKVSVIADSLLSNADSNNPNNITALRGWVISAAIVGSNKLTIQRGRTGTPAIEITSVANTFSGTWQVDEGLLKGTGVGSLGIGNSFNIVGNVNGAVTGPAQLDTDYPLVTTGTLTVGALGAILLDQNDVFSAVTVNGTPLSVGLHPYAELNANFPANFPAGGSGSITVTPAPEPATVGLLAIAGLAGLRRRRRA